MNTIKEILHKKREATEKHIKQLQQEGKQGIRYTAMIPDIPFLILGLLSDIGWAIHLIAGIIYFYRNGFHHMLDAMTLIALIAVIFGVVYIILTKLYITFFLSFYILSNVRKALFYRLYGHFYFLFTFAYRGISSYVFPLKRGKFRGKYFYAIRRFISVLALSIEECAYQSIVILILE